MDVNDIVNAFNSLLDLCDSLDDSGAGIQALSITRSTTRELCKMELGQFLLYVADGSSLPNDGQARIINIVLGDMYPTISQFQIKQVAKDVGIPDASSNATLTVFMMTDAAIAQQKGAQSSSLTGLLIRVYETFGRMMVSQNKNAISEGRCNLYLSAFKAKASSGVTGRVTGTSVHEPAPKTTSVSRPSAAKTASSSTAKAKSTSSSKSTTTKMTTSSSAEKSTAAKKTESSTVKKSASSSTAKATSANAKKTASTSVKKDTARGTEEKATNKKVQAEKTSSGKVTKTQLKAEIQEVYNGHIKYRFREAVTRQQLFASMTKEKYIGIHDVVGEAEWISPKGIWAMLIPAGFSYTMDIEETPKIPGVDVASMDAQIQLTGHTSFGTAEYAKPISIDIYPTLGTVQCDDPFNDLRSDKAEKAIENFVYSLLPSLPDHVWENLKDSRETAVYYAAQGIKNGKQVTYKLIFLVFCAGTTQVTGGQISIEHASYTDNLLSLATDMLNTITKVPQVRDEDLFVPQILPSEYTLTFDKGNKILGPDGITVGIPDNYKCSTNKAVIGNRLLSIVHEKQKYWNGESESDQHAIPVDFSMMTMDASDFPTSPELAGKVAKQIIAQTAHLGVFTAQGALYLAKVTENGTILFQQLTDYGNTKEVALRAIVIMNKRVRLFTIRINIQHEIRKQFYNLLLYEMGELAIAFFRHFSLDGEDLYDYGRCSAKPVYPEDIAEAGYCDHLRIINSQCYSTRRSADFRALSIKELLSHNGHQFSETYQYMDKSDGDYTLYRDAISLAKVFRLKDGRFDASRDREALIRMGMIENVSSIHALRSLAWIVTSLVEEDHRQLSDISFVELTEIGEDIKKSGWLAYNIRSLDLRCNGLCKHEDWHVFYVPEVYIDAADNGKIKEADLIYQCGKENRGGNTISFFAPGLGLDSLRENDAINQLISRDDECLASLEELRDDLIHLLPIMQTIYNGLMADRNRNQKLEGTLPDILAAWCAYSIAAKEPFYSEEAADTPEADAALKGPLVNPADNEEYTMYDIPSSTNRFNSYSYEANDDPGRAFDAYRQDMEAACKAGKSLQEMIAAGRKTVESSFMGDMDAFDQAIKNLDRDANIVFSGKHFVLTGFGEYEGGIIAEIEERGGVVHSHMVKMADYLVVCLESPGISKVKEALNWRKKGASNQIVSDYQMWQAMLGKSSFGNGVQNITTAGSKPSYSSEATSRGITGTPNQAVSTTASKSASSTRSSAINTTSGQMAGLEETVSSTASVLANAARTVTTAEEKKAIKEAQSILENMQSEMSSTSSALKKHAENLRKQEEEKEKRMAEARAKGKSSKDEMDMLVVLLIEEDQGNLNRPDDEFATTFAEDFAAYTPQQLIRLRAKVKPKMHDSSFVEAAKEDMLSRSVKERFGISTANWFNMSNLWDFNDKGAKAIEKTRQYYRDSEMFELRNLMSDHKQAGIDSVNRQLGGFNSAWDSFGGVRNDLHICIGKCDEPIPESHKVFDVMIDGVNHVYIHLQHPSMGYLTIPIMNLFASVWKTTPDKVWDAALNNSISDSRSVSTVTSRTDAMKAKSIALEAIGIKTPEVKRPGDPSSVPTPKSRPETLTSSASSYNASMTNSNSKRIKEIEETMTILRTEYDSVSGIFGFMKKNKIKKELNELEQELASLKRSH